MPAHQAGEHHPFHSVFKGRDGWNLLPILFFFVVLGGQLIAATGPASAQIPKGDITIELETVASGLTAPLGVTHAHDGSGRLFIYEQTGLIHIVVAGVVLPAPFLDISSKIVTINPFFDERGLIGLAFHPDYAQNGRFFVRYSAPRTGAPSEPCFGTSRGCHSEVLAEFSVSAGDPNLADLSSEIILFRVDEPQFNHDGGEVAFGPDGFLYFSLGDGGGAHDGLADIPPSHGPIGNGQNIETALGAILRIDVDGPPELGLDYAIPGDNPFVGVPGVDEIYAYGLRNPYRFSFDDGPGGDGRLFLGDVGQNLFEEVNIVEKGGNYGWVIREGLSCFDPFNPLVPPVACASTGPLGEPLIDPIVDYSHAEGGISVIGGFVYRGSSLLELLGTYVFGDFSAQFAIPLGRLYFLVEPVPGSFEIREFKIGLDDDPYGLFLKGFGEDEDGEIYICGSTNLAPTGSGGIVQRIVPLPTVPVFIQRLQARPVPGGVELAWQTEITGNDEINGFNVYRKVGKTAPPVRINQAGLISADSRSYVDSQAESGVTYGYTLGVVLQDGSELLSITVSAERLAYAYNLGQNYPNPFNPSTTIRYELEKKGLVQLSVYDIEGRLVRRLVNRVESPGHFSVEWNGRNESGSSVVSGIYFYQLSAEKHVLTKKMLLLK